MRCSENVTYNNVFVSGEHGNPVIVCCDISCIRRIACKVSHTQSGKEGRKEGR